MPKKLPKAVKERAFKLYLTEEHSAKEIAAKLNIEGPSSYVRISELKRQAVNKLIDNVDHSQVLDYL